MILWKSSTSASAWQRFSHGGALNWGTLQNKRCKNEIPAECFVRSGTRVLIVRDPFLTWWGSTLLEARQPDARRPGRGRDPDRAIQPERDGAVATLATPGSTHAEQAMER